MVDFTKGQTITSLHVHADASNDLTSAFLLQRAIEGGFDEEWMGGCNLWANQAR